MKTIIIGGVAGGASAAARLRRLDEQGEIIILERGNFISFANCGLPYYIGGAIKEESKLTLQTPASFKGRFNIDVRINSEAVKIDPAAKTVAIRNLTSGQTYTETYDKLILSPGAEPIRPNLPGMTSPRVMTLRNIPDTFKVKSYLAANQPKSAVVVGGGYIGVEMAENLAEAGLAVTIVELADHLIAPLDFDLAVDVHKYVRDKGIKLLLKNGLQSLEDDGQKLTLTLTRGTLTTDFLIMSVGVRPESSLAKSAGLKVNTKGAIQVNERLQTSDPDIYAVGDAIEVKNLVTGQPAFIPLAGPANKQGRIAADNICGLNSTYTGTQGSAVLKIFEMTVATTGLNETAAKAAGLDYDKTYTSSPSHAGYYPGARNMSIKLLWEKQSLRILGAQIVGYEGVDKRLDVLATALRLGAKVTDLAHLELCYAPPFSSAKDPVNMLGFIAENITTGKLKQFFWHDVAALPRDGSVTLLDVRQPEEYAKGHIEGFINIPLSTLRNNLDRLPKDKPLYVHCLSGLRSYIAYRILIGRGYDCYNLAGGWRQYHAVMSEL